jgi:lipopolysaccharide biosynthesis protein
VSLRTAVRRLPARWSRQDPPAFEVIKPPLERGRWILYFMFLPQGRLAVQHHFTLDRLANEEARVMIVCACPPGHEVLDELKSRCDALCWKGTQGFDFSAYAIGLAQLAARVPHSDVLVMNDSMLGPFAPLSPFIDQAPWALTGFTANPQIENHLQSYAFILKDVNPQTVRQLSKAISPEWSYSEILQVILFQETRMARVAHQHMSVGAHWYTDGSLYEDLCLKCPVQLLDSGFPLLKRSLFGKFAGRFQDPAAMKWLLKRVGHPDIGET